MERLNSSKMRVPRYFLLSALFFLSFGLLWGLTGALQYLVPGLFKSYFSFEKVRPLHVSSMVFWILLAAIGTVLTYLPQAMGGKVYSARLLQWKWSILPPVFLLILLSYAAGIFGGREYWEFHPAFSVLVVTGWVLFMWNVLRTIGTLRNRPVYVWMWATGAVFFLFTYLEANLWMIPFFGNHLVKDTTIQWKSYGSMVGAWNMLIYGSSLYLMEKISGNRQYARSGMAFLLYFTGLFNLMFNWGHHIYTLPTMPFVKHISYAVSMTELFILGRILFQWRSTLTEMQKHFHHFAFRFYAAAELWVMLTLVLAILMSVPGINVYTHGTHITVAHTMGATIGINSFLLLAFAYDILQDSCRSLDPYRRQFKRAYWTIQISLLVFWISLILAGVVRSRWQMSHAQVSFAEMMHQMRPFMIIFLFSGLLLSLGLIGVIFPLVKNQLACLFRWRQANAHNSESLWTPVS